MLVLAAIAILITLLFGLALYGAWHNEWSGYNASLSYSLDGSCNIAVVPIFGDIIPYAGAYGMTPDMGPSTDPDTAGSILRFAEQDPLLKAQCL